MVLFHICYMRCLRKCDDLMATCEIVTIFNPFFCAHVELQLTKSTLGGGRWWQWHELIIHLLRL